jgi:hypothetical protein
VSYKLFLLFICNFIFIYLKSFQQLNVVYKKYWWVMPTSFCLAAAEAYMWIAVVTTGYKLDMILAIALGGGLGCVCSMYTHKRFEEWLKNWKS